MTHCRGRDDSNYKYTFSEPFVIDLTVEVERSEVHSCYTERSWQEARQKEGNHGT